MAIYRGAAEKMVEMYDFEWEENLRMKEACICSVENVMANAINISIVILFAVLTGLVKEIAVYFLTFGVMRCYAGGAHAKNHFQCIILYICIMCASIITAKLLVNLPEIYTYCMCAISIVISGGLNSKYAARQKNIGTRRTEYRKKALTIHKIISAFITIVCIGYPNTNSSFWQEIILIQTFALMVQSMALFINRKECVN